MAASPRWKVYTAAGAYQASGRTLVEACAVVWLLEPGATVRDGHARVVFTLPPLALETYLAGLPSLTRDEQRDVGGLVRRFVLHLAALATGSAVASLVEDHSAPVDLPASRDAVEDADRDTPDKRPRPRRRPRRES